MQRTLSMALTVAIALAVATPASAVRARTRLVSKTSQGEPASNGTDQSVISANGRFAAFQTNADNLPGANTYSQVYVHDSEMGKTRLASRTTGGEAGTDSSGIPSLSANGRFVAFESEAPNLPGGDGATRRVYVHDRETGRTRLISRTGDDDPARGSDPFMSAGGRLLAFQSIDSGLPQGNGITQRIYVVDRGTGTVRLASLTSDGQPVQAFDPALSASGRYLAFSSQDPELPGSTGDTQIYVRDRRAGTTRLVSRNNQGEAAGGSCSSWAAISGDGSVAAFYCESPNFPGGGGDVSLVYAFDLETRRLRLVSRTSAGEVAEADAFDPSLSGSGRYVTFYSNSDNLPGADGYSDAYRFDLRRDRLLLVSRTSSGAPAEGGSSDTFDPAISADGRWVVFRSDATNLPGEGSQTYIRGPLD
jgi:TolB protein